MHHAAERAERGHRGWTALYTSSLLVLFAWAFWTRYSLLASTPYPMGVDGYFYAIQLRSLLADGSLYYPSSPLALWFLAPFAALTDPITGSKLGAAVASALMVFPASALGRRLGRGHGAGILAAVLVASSAQSIYLSTEFVKHGLGLTVAMTYLCALAWALDPAFARDNRSRTIYGHRFAVAGALLLATALTHKLALVWALVSTLPPLVVTWRDPSRRPRTGIMVAGVAMTLVLLGGSGLLTGTATGTTSGTAASGTAALELVWRMFGGGTTWDVSIPSLHVPGNAPLRFQHEAAIAGVLAGAALLLWLVSALLPRFARAARPSSLLSLSSSLSSPAHDRSLVLGPALLALVAALPFLDVHDPQGLAFRCRVSAFVPLAICAAAVAGAVLARFSARRAALVLVPFALAFLIARPTHSREGVVEVHPALQAGVRALRGVVPEGHTIITPERHLMFMATWYTRQPARLRPEPVEPSLRWRLVPMAYMSAELRAAIDRARTGDRDAARSHLPPPRGLHPGHEHGLVIMPEITWQSILHNLSPDLEQHYQHWPTL